MEFSDIAAYPETLVGATLRRLSADPQLRALLEKASALPGIFRKKNLNSLFRWMRTFNSVEEFQNMMMHIIRFNIKATTDGLTVSGIENLDTSRPRLYLSNHRSIGLDSVYLNYLCYAEKWPTVFSAAGDNLMQVPWVQHFIRLNKGFVVKRNVDDPDEKLEEAARLSRYIHSLLEGGDSVWIAHRGGRAKDGNDATDSAVLSMLRMNDSYSGMEEWSNAVQIIPMAISWERVANDVSLTEDSLGRSRPQAMHRDLANILGEINEWKGRVHISFGRRVTGAKRAGLVNAIDREIQSNFRLWDANWEAYRLTHLVSRDEEELLEQVVDRKRAERVLAGAEFLDLELRQAYLAMYSRPVENAVRHAGSLAGALAAQSALKATTAAV